MISVEPQLMLDFNRRGGNAYIPAPLLCIVMVTYKRTELALRTVHSVCEKLIYPKEMRQWYIADDGSPREHVNDIFYALEAHSETLYGYHNEKLAPGTYNAGKGWNLGLRKGHELAPVILWLEDDWELKGELDICFYVQLLMENEKVGIIRLGHLAVDSEVRIVGYDGIHYLNYLKTTPYAYSGNPLLRHRRFLDAYGFFAEDRNPGEMELHYDDVFRHKEGPEIWRPADIPGWGIFGHMGTEKSFA